MDFSDLKKIIQTEIINKIDHSLILPSTLGPKILKELKTNFSNLLIVNYQPTSEQLLTDFASRIHPLLPEGINLIRLRLRETGSSYAEWTPE